MYINCNPRGNSGGRALSVSKHYHSMSFPSITDKGYCHIMINISPLQTLHSLLNIHLYNVHVYKFIYKTISNQQCPYTLRNTTFLR